VEISLDGGSTWTNATLSGSSWSYAWTPTAQGGYLVKARATDKAAWAEDVGAGIRLFYSDAKVIVTSHINNQYVTTPTQTITGIVIDTTLSSGTLTFNGTDIPLTITNGAFSQAVAFAEGVNTILVKAGGDSSGTITVRLDTIPPSGVVDLISKTHTIKTYSKDKVVTVSWKEATDATSGVDGYSIVWDTSPTTLPDTTKDIEEDVTTASSSSLADGISYYFHMRCTPKVVPI
jgi:hypothetical protein